MCVCVQWRGVHQERIRRTCAGGGGGYSPAFSVYLCARVRRRGVHEGSAFSVYLCARVRRRGVHEGRKAGIRSHPTPDTRTPTNTNP